MSSPSIWELIQNGDTEARNTIWEQYQPAVDYVSRKLGASLPKHVSLDDLKSAGQFGLLDAITKFDPARGYKFETYALQRIRGSILDDLRSQDWVPRSVRQKDRGIEAATQELTQYYGRHPTDDEIAGYLEIDIAELDKARSTSQANVVVNIEQPTDGDAVLTIGDSLTDDTGDLSDLLATFDTEAVLAALESLPKRESLTIALHYKMGLTLAEIGRKYGVTESRVCQIHTKALTSIREHLIT